MDKLRLDALLVERGLCPTRERAKTTVMSGLVYVDGQKAEKPGAGVRTDCALEVRQAGPGFVSRGGLKLQKALDSFGVDPDGRNVLDCGASTGGFTDCLLRHGARRVWAIDVGYGQLAWCLRNDDRVTCMERFNVRALTRGDIGAEADLAVMDLSFISLGLVVPVVRDVLCGDKEMILLVKPQFEAGRERVGKNGVVRDRAVHADVLRAFADMVMSAGLHVWRFTHSPVKGPKGNIEFLAHVKAQSPPSPPDPVEAAAEAHAALNAKEGIE